MLEITAGTINKDHFLDYVTDKITKWISISILESATYSKEEAG